jgi:predicted ABC-class ATPase
MRDYISQEDEIDNMKRHVSKCFEKNIDEAFIRRSIDSVTDLEPFRRIAREQDLQAAKEDTQIIYKAFEIHQTSIDAKDQQSFWDFHRWMNYIDKALNPDES